MTPLAAYLAKQLVVRQKHRRDAWTEPQNLTNLRDTLHDIHCFEVSKVLPLVGQLLDRLKREATKDEGASAEQLYATYSFLPAPKTWMEFKHPCGYRIGFAFEEAKDSDKWAIEVTFFDRVAPTPLGRLSTRGADYYDYGGWRYWPEWLSEYTGGVDPGRPFLALTHTMLVLINTPRIIGRQQHMPNAGLERNLTRGLGVGKFPLHAWTEIQLRVAKPIEIDDGEPHEAHLTGRRALHFCRKHIRIRNGQLEYVSAHWRGDPALGIKRSRYTVTP